MVFCIFWKESGFGSDCWTFILASFLLLILSNVWFSFLWSTFWIKIFSYTRCFQARRFFFGVHSDLAALMFWCLWNYVSVSILYFPAVLRLLFSGGLRKAHTDTEVQDAASSIWRAKAIMSAKPQGKKKLINTSPNNSFVRSCHNYILSAIALLKDLKTFPGLREPQIGHWIMEERGGKHLRLWGL